MGDGLIRADILGRLLVIQQSLEVMPNVGGMASFLQRALKEVPGLRDVRLYVGQTLYPPDEQIAAFCRKTAGHMRSLGETVRGEPLLLLPVDTVRRDYGHLVLTLSDPEAFAPYLEFLQNTAGVIAKMLETRDHVAAITRANQELTQMERELEDRVLARTAELAERNAQLNAEIAQRKAYQNALRRSEDRYRSVVEATSDVIWSTDPDGQVVEDLPSWRNFTGQTESEIKGWGWIDAIHPEDRERVLSAWSKSLALHGPYDTWYRLRWRDGGYRPVNGRGVPVLEEDGTVREWVGICTDTTERVVAEQEAAEYRRHLEVESAERQRAEKALFQAQKLDAVGQLTGGIAHDFNNLLTVLSGNLDLIREAGGDPARIEKLSAAMQRAIERASRLTSQLLVFSRKKVLHPEIAEVDRILHEFDGLIRRAAGEAVTVEIRAAPDLWPCRVDPAQLEAAVLNLVLNARDAMPQGGTLDIALRNVVLSPDMVRQWGEVAPGDYVALSVTDTGTGVPPEAMAHLFEPFFTTKEIGKGSGLGLAMVWGFAKQSNGHVTIESQPGQGTVASLYLPRASSPADREEPLPVEDLHRKGVGKILLVEDDEEVIEVTAMALEELGYDVRRARNGREALVVLETEPKPDLIISDVVMPQGMSGIELARAARKADPHMKVLLVSGYADDVLARHGGSHREFPLLSKPYRLPALAEAVHAAISNETA